MTVESFILIGGRSVRFGEDKAFATFGRRPLAEHSAATAAEAFPDRPITFVTSSEAQFDGRLVFSLGYPSVADIRPGFGAWSGFYTAVNYARADLVLVLACDLPLVTADLLRLLAGHVTSDVDAVIPRQPDGRLQPLCGIYRAAAVRSSANGIEFGRASMPSLASFVEGLRTRVVEEGEYARLTDARELFANVNTPDALSAALRSRRGD